MALLKSKFSEVPSDAVLLTREEAIRYQANIIQHWNNKWDVFALKYGSPMLASVTAFVAMYINTHYRNKFRLLQYGVVGSYLPTVAIPTAMTFLLHNQVILQKVLISEDCPTCIQMRAAAFQSTLGLIFPCMLAPVSAIAYSQRLGTNNLPYLTGWSSFKSMVKVVHGHTKPIANKLFALYLGQALVASLVTYFEAKNVHTISKKLLLFDREIDITLAKNVQ